MKIRVNEHKCEILKTPVNEKELNVTVCEFEFADNITDDYVKEAYFTFKGTTYKKIIINNKCDIPPEVLTEKGQVELGVVAYIVENGDPSKYTVTFAINNGKGLIYLNNPEKPIIEWFNEELENLIANNRYADYAATKVKNGYMIELVLPHVNTLSGLIYGFIYEFGDDYKVSCITDGVMDKVSGKVSERGLK